MNTISPANKPSRVQISSDDAIDPQLSASPGTADNYCYNQFTVALAQPILGCKGLQLATFVQPNVPADGPCIPDYQASEIGFFYYKSGILNQPTAGSLLSVYLISSQNQGSTPLAYQNRYFSSYADLVVALNAAATFLAAGPSGGPDVVFTYDSTTKKIYFTGQDNTQYYTPAGYDDPAVSNYINAVANLPQSLNYTLNQRLGFCNKVYNLSQQQAGGSVCYPDSYPNLVRTGSITVRTNFNFQSSINSKDNRDVLAVVPQSEQFLGVNIYNPPIPHYLTSVPETIQQMTFSLWDDQGQPLNIANSAQTLVDIVLHYGGTSVIQ